MSWRPTYLRILAWAACPLRCPYCHREGEKGHTHAPDTDSLVRRADAAYRAGVRKLKLLGGEPLLRPDLPRVIRGILAAAPDCDLSIITSGAVPPRFLEDAFQAGLHRANLTLHGWTPQAFAERGGTPHMLDWRWGNLDLLLARGRPFKLNYVFRGPRDDGDLAALLAWVREARPTGCVVGILDDLQDPHASSETVMTAVERLAGPWRRQRVEEDVHSLPSLHLDWEDGLIVEIKTSRLGERAPWKACGTCASRGRCREGTLALRLTSDGRFTPCMDRPDLALALPPSFEPDPAARALRAWLQEMTP